MGINVADGEGPVKFPVQGREEYHGETAAAKEVRELDIPAVGGNNEGDGNGGDKDINSPEAEYGCAIHCDAADSGPVQKRPPGGQVRGCLGGGGKRSGLDLKGAQEKAAEAAAETEMEADSESEDNLEGATGGRGEEESQGARGSSGAEWSRAEDDQTSTFVGQGSTAGTTT